MRPDLEASRIGEVVGGKYRVVRLLARGGMGVVYEAQHAVVRRRFAIKFLRRDLADRRDILTRFQREAEAAGALENENVIAAVDFGIANDGTPYIVMEYLVGESLASLLERDGRLSIGRAADLIGQACRGVAAAHGIGIVHRDLKPQNLFVCRREDGADLLKVLDFGVAKLQALDEASADTRTGTVLGTAAYMSPEQARGDKKVDARTDVYALGAILYELVSQRRPHPGTSQNAILHHIATQPAVPLETVQEGLPDAFVALVARTLASDPALRPGSAESLAQELGPFALRSVWPVTREESGPSRAELTSTLLAPGQRPVTPPSASSLLAPAADVLAAATPARPGRARGRRILGGLAIAAAFLVVAALARRHPPAPVASRAAAQRHRARVLVPSTTFLAAEPDPGAVKQIEELLGARAVHDAGLVSAMVATPSAIWFIGGSPQQVQLDVSGTVSRGARQGRVPILVAYNHPFRDCTGYGLAGALDTAAYRAWIDAFASGIGNETAVVILEPNSLGLIPYGKRLDGKEDKCKPTLADAEGNRVQPGGANPDERYRQLAYAIDSLASRAPHAAVYLDGTHSSWLPAGEAAYRLEQAGVARAAGFFLNAGNYQPTGRLIEFGTWVGKCLYYARKAASGASSPEPYRRCATTPEWTDPSDDQAWNKADAWYVEQVDRAPNPPGPEALTHFVLNTNRNGRGPLVAAEYADSPYRHPPAVIKALREGSWCMPPGRGLGARPTADTGQPLVDAYLWTDTPGMSVASCDIAGGARAWDYARYNPWRIEGDAQNHFDPLWGRVLPPAGAWFPEEALQLARDANPPLDEQVPVKLVERSNVGPQPILRQAIPSPGAPATVESAGGGARPPAPERAAGPGPGGSAAQDRPGRPGVLRRAGGTAAAPAPASARRPDEAGQAGEARKEQRPAVTFDPDNPYR
jgi:endoglucanase